MDERATGVVLRTRPLTETSLIIHWLTAEHGRVATVARGARRPKSPFRGKLDLYYLAELSFLRSQRTNLHTLVEVRLSDTQGRLREDYRKLQLAAYATALLEQATESDTPLPEFFELFTGLLQHLTNQPAEAEAVLAFELKSLRLLGLEPDLYDSKHTEGTRALLRKLTNEPWPEIAKLRATGSQSREIAQFLHGFLIYHLGRLPRGRAAALAEE